MSYSTVLRFHCLISWLWLFLPLFRFSDLFLNHTVSLCMIYVSLCSNFLIWYMHLMTNIWLVHRKWSKLAVWACSIVLPKSCFVVLEWLGGPWRVEYWHMTFISRSLIDYVFGPQLLLTGKIWFGNIPLFQFFLIWSMHYFALFFFFFSVFNT